MSTLLVSRRRFQAKIRWSDRLPLLLKRKRSRRSLRVHGPGKVPVWKTSVSGGGVLKLKGDFGDFQVGKTSCFFEKSTFCRPIAPGSGFRARRWLVPPTCHSPRSQIRSRRSAGSLTAGDRGRFRYPKRSVGPRMTGGVQGGSVLFWGIGGSEARN